MAEVSDRRMTPGLIVELLDVVEHTCSGLVPRAAGFGLDALRDPPSDLITYFSSAPNIANGNRRTLSAHRENSFVQI